MKPQTGEKRVKDIDAQNKKGRKEQKTQKSYTIRVCYSESERREEAKKRLEKRLEKRENT